MDAFGRLPSEVINEIKNIYETPIITCKDSVLIITHPYATYYVEIPTSNFVQQSCVDHAMRFVDEIKVGNGTFMIDWGTLEDYITINVTEQHIKINTFTVKIVLNSCLKNNLIDAMLQYAAYLNTIKK